MPAITNLQYVPVLKWRQGEYQALLRLAAHEKARTVPLIEVTPPDFDFEEWAPKKTIDLHLEKFAQRLQQKWEKRFALLDAGLIPAAVRMKNGDHPLAWLLNEARHNGARIVPVTTIGRDDAYQDAVREAHSIDGRGTVLRCTLEDSTEVDFTLGVFSLMKKIGISLHELDVVLDLKTPNFQPLDGLAELIRGILQGNIWSNARSVVIVGTAFPSSMGEITGPLQFISRDEWLLYKVLASKILEDQRIPTFGDYAIAGPELPRGDMRLLKPAATVRYTVDDGWIIAKGTNVRDNGFEQFRGCCSSVKNSSQYLGSEFSSGSNYIDRCRIGLASTGNLSTWRWVGTNHHIAKVVDDLANFFEP